MHVPRSRAARPHGSSTLRCPSLAALGLLFLSGCGGGSTPAPRPAAEAPAAAPTTAPGTVPPAPPPAAGPLFRDVAAESGLTAFRHFPGATGRLYYPETVGSGCALLDFDGDGDLDAFFVQGAIIEPGATDASSLTPPPAAPGCRLFRNELRETGTLRFTDVTDAAGIHVVGHGMGVAAADVDRDGDVDLLVTAMGPDHFLRNQGDGTFVDDTARAGLADDRWTTSATFFDADRDGWVDLYVDAYIDWRVETHRTCEGTTGAPDYCGPRTYPPLSDRLYRNRGDGTFEDVSDKAGLLAHPGPGLGVIATDFDGDGWPDLYVANDQEANVLWMNGQDGTFKEKAALSGCAFSGDGQREASMGVDVADLDEDGDEDLIVTNLRLETNTLYVNDGNGRFRDRTLASGIGAPSVPWTSWGVAFLDADHDTLLDLVAVSGGVLVVEEQRRAGDPWPLREPDQLFIGLGDGRFREAPELAGPDLTRLAVSRGLAMGDVDEDGDEDLLINDAGEVPRLLLGQPPAGTHWIGLRTLDADGRDLDDVRVEIVVGGKTLHRRTHRDGTYASSSAPGLVIGLGTATRLDGLAVIWPDGTREQVPALAVDARHVIRRARSSP